jgi:hypothetical protein
MDTVITIVFTVIFVGVPILGVLIGLARHVRAKWRDFNAPFDTLGDPDLRKAG